MHLHWRFSSVLHTASVLRISSVLHTASVLRRLLVYYTPQVCHTSPLQCITHHQSITHCKCIIHSTATSVLHFSHSIYEEQPLEEIRPVIVLCTSGNTQKYTTAPCSPISVEQSKVKCSIMCCTKWNDMCSIIPYTPVSQHVCVSYCICLTDTVCSAGTALIYICISYCICITDTCLCITMYLPHRHSVHCWHSPYTQLTYLYIVFVL